MTSPGQNLGRCRAQFALAADMERKWEEMRIGVQDREIYENFPVFFTGFYTFFLYDRDRKGRLHEKSLCDAIYHTALEKETV